MTTESSGAATGPVRALLGLEGICVFAMATYIYAHGEHSWMLFAVLFLLPDVSFAAYVAGPRFGAFGYNLMHSYAGPLLLAVALLATGRPPILALIWGAHIGFDRLLGYGLKYPSGFGDTQLGVIGRRDRSRPAA